MRKNNGSDACTGRRLGGSISFDYSDYRYSGHCHYGLCPLQDLYAGAEYEGGQFGKGAADLSGGTGAFFRTAPQRDQLYHEPHGESGAAGPDHPVPAGDPPDSGAGGQPPLYSFLHSRGIRRSHGAGHQPDGAGLYGDVPDPHRCADRL